MIDGSTIAADAARILPELLLDWLGAPVAVVRQAEPDRGADLLVTGDDDLRLAVICKSSNRSAIVAQAARQAAAGAERTDALPVVVVPFMGRAGAAAAAESGVSWIDLSGNADLRVPGRLVVHVEGKPNRRPERGRPSTPFAPASSRIARRMLIEPDRWWRQRDLALASGLAPSQVSKVVHRLVEEDLVLADGVAQGARYRPSSADALLDGWAGEYDFRSHLRIPVHITGRGVAVAESLGDLLRSADVRHAFTGLPAAWQIDGFAQFRLVSVYVEEELEGLVARLGLRQEDEGGANVELIAPSDRGVFDGGTEFGALSCVHPVQTYLDLLRLPERAQEAAEHIREAGRIFGVA